MIFTSSLPTDCSSWSGSATTGADLTSSGTGGFNSLPLLKVTTAFTSSVLAFESSVSPISFTTL